MASFGYNIVLVIDFDGLCRSFCCWSVYIVIRKKIVIVVRKINTIWRLLLVCS